MIVASGFSRTLAIKIPSITFAIDGLTWYDWYSSDAGWSSPVARWAHNPKVAGSNPAPATNKNGPKMHFSGPFYCVQPTFKNRPENTKSRHERKAWNDAFDL
jgi:hypothetical protein